LGAYPHQDVPFEKVVEELQPPRNPGRAPLFQVMFALQNAPIRLPALVGLSVRTLKVKDSTAKFDLSLSMREDDGGLSGEVGYNTDLFEEATIRRLVDDYQALLEQVTADPGRALSRLTPGAGSVLSRPGEVEAVASGPPPLTPE